MNLTGSRALSSLYFRVRDSTPSIHFANAVESVDRDWIHFIRIYTPP